MYKTVLAVKLRFCEVCQHVGTAREDKKKRRSTIVARDNQQLPSPESIRESWHREVSQPKESVGSALHHPGPFQAVPDYPVGWVMGGSDTDLIWSLLGINQIVQPRKTINETCTKYVPICLMIETRQMMVKVQVHKQSTGVLINQPSSINHQVFDTSTPMVNLPHSMARWRHEQGIWSIPDLANCHQDTAWGCIWDCLRP